jgi:hypothetical protein
MTVTFIATSDSEAYFCRWYAEEEPAAPAPRDGWVSESSQGQSTYHQTDHLDI